MTTFQKVVKYLAIAFAILLCVGIFGGIISGIAAIAPLLDKAASNEIDGSISTDKEMTEFAVNGDIEKLYIDIGAADLTLEYGEKTYVKYDKNRVNVKEDGAKLVVSEKTRLFNIDGNTDIVVCLANGTVLADADIDTGAGSIKCDGLVAETLDVDFGAGGAELRNITVTREADIDGGAGKLAIDGGSIRNLDFDMGAGRTEIRCRLEGKNKLDLGVGACVLELFGTENDYCLRFDKGIGNITADGRNVRDGDVLGSGENIVDIDGGVGNVSVMFEEK